MKKQSFALSALCTLALAISASGDLARYTFEGTINSIDTYDYIDNEFLSYAQISQAFGHQLGDAVLYEFLVDTDLSATSPGLPSGTSPYWDGETTSYQNWTAEYFYIDFVGNSLIGENITGSLNQQRGSTTEFVPIDQNQEAETSRTISFTAQNDLSMLTVLNYLDSIGAWGVDTIVRGFESYAIEDEATGISTGTTIYSTMRITAIEPLPTSVPEPSTGLLLAGGLIIMLGTVRLRKPSGRDRAAPR